MTIEHNGVNIIIDFLTSSGRGLIAYKRGDTKIINGYIYNIYTRNTNWLKDWEDWSKLKYHKKLKIYKHPDGINFYFNVNNQRLFCEKYN